MALAGVFEFPAGERVEDRIIARPVAARAALAIGARIVERDVGVVRAYAFLAEPEIRRALETHIVMHDLGPFEQPLEDRLRRGLGEVEREAAFRARGGLVKAVHAADAVAGARRSEGGGGGKAGLSKGKPWRGREHYK